MIFDILKEKNNITHWFYGHFHLSHTDIINDNILSTKFIALNVNEFVSLP